MISECIAIIAIALMMVATFLKSRNTDYAISVLPIMVLPVSHISFFVIMRFLGARLLPRYPFPLLLSLSDIAAVAVACLLIWALSTKIKSQRNKKFYIVLMSLYNVILAFAFVIQILAPFIEQYNIAI